MQIKVSGEIVFLQTSPEWRQRSTAARGSRKLARQRLGVALKRATNKVHSRKPKFSSISHTEHLGGFVIAKCPVGFDVEARNRAISVRAANWFTSPAERRAIENPLYIWVMKEAAYKALRGPLQPPTVKSIVILAAKTSQNNTLTFNFAVQNARDIAGSGILRINSRTIMGIAVLLT